MLKAIAIDDEPLALEVIKSHASKVSFLDLQETYTDAFKAIDYLQQQQVDLLFLDIKMPDISGMEFATLLRTKPMIVFTTAYSEHAVKSFELDAVDYLLKPFSLARFTKACTKANELWQLRNSGSTQDYLFIKTGYEQVKVFLDDVLFLAANGNYITFQLEGAKHLSRMTFSEAEALLNKNFIRVHRSFIVNKEKITKIERHQLTLGQSLVPIGSSYADNLLTK
ncbi:MAG TPA: LytTR family DNA-binding domain-containing protein [Cyclobacteriaceae bacterium]|nr:LytTR family DNA-binding domain-containing protein [Cyclobacteriaceae bacterium]